ARTTTANPETTTTTTSTGATKAVSPSSSRARPSAARSSTSRTATRSSRRSCCYRSRRKKAEGGLLGVEPVRADADVDLERRIELCGATHCAPHQLGRVVHLPRGALEEELVVDLEDQARSHAGLPQRQLTADHRDLDDVGGRPLDHRVDRQPLAEPAGVG